MRREEWILIAGILCLSACSNPRASSEIQVAKESKSNQEEVLLSLARQAAPIIEIHPVALSQEPSMLRVKGRIALADDRIWRVGVRTVGSGVAVYAGVGECVPKVQTLAL